MVVAKEVMKKKAESRTAQERVYAAYKKINLILILSTLLPIFTVVFQFASMLYLDAVISSKLGQIADNLINIAN
jgi:hypothetical protein